MAQGIYIEEIGVYQLDCSAALWSTNQIHDLPVDFCKSRRGFIDGSTEVQKSLATPLPYIAIPLKKL